MEKEYFEDLKKKEVIHDGETSVIYRLEDGRILKTIKPLIEELCNRFNLDYEAKISSPLADEIDEIVKPLTKVYCEDRCIGYTMEEVIGKSLGDYEKNISLEEQCDFNHYLKIYPKLEQILKKGNSKGIVFPDICTAGNIIITPNEEIRLIDFDGLQLGPKDKSMSMSNSLGNPAKYIENKKFSKYRFHFTPEIDKTCLTILFYLLLFRVNINNVGVYNGFDAPITYEEIFKYINLKDQNLINKTITNLSDKGKCSFLESDLLRLAKKNIIVPMEYFEAKDIYTKRLIPKKY